MKKSPLGYIEEVNTWHHEQVGVPLFPREKDLEREVKKVIKGLVKLEHATRTETERTHKVHGRCCRMSAWLQQANRRAADRKYQFVADIRMAKPFPVRRSDNHGGRTVEPATRSRETTIEG
eukprot:SAG11_NODE_3733_length_2258_cov_1.394627_4_plen_121_part_00